MKRIQETVVAYISIIFGALLLLIYLNALGGGNGLGIVLGVIALVMAIYYIAIGVIDAVAGDKLPAKANKIFGIISIAAYPVLFFVQLLIVMIGNKDFFVPTGWVISILGMVASLGFAIIYVVSKFAGSLALKKITRLCGMVFALVMLLNVLFDAFGAPNALGQISLIGTITYIAYGFMLYTALKEKEEAVEPVPAPVQEEAEEAPTEIAPEEAEPEEEPKEEPKVEE